MADLVVAITGASGGVYAVRLLDVLLHAGRNVHLTISPAAARVFEEELGLTIRPDDFALEQLLPDLEAPASERLRQLLPRVSWRVEGNRVIPQDGSQGGIVRYHHHYDYGAGIASGSFRTAGMVICPCSMGTLGSIANGLSTNLVHRAADVHLKERRKLILVPRETPLGSIQLGNMQRLVDAGAVVLPAMPGWYHQPRDLQDLVDFIVSRVCDQLGVEANLMRRWGEEPPEPASQ
ncbi:putative aromatic acid decarboxylase [Maioricimonas rarisocia]|uniref:Flavin prenyltransferase UbiX n=1 Tax=Maioricimonas rarisocia TaxID=2528026 RepID=A0A517Z8D4_9PLAN|nr:flavin prenyltransferase UbiX [Maioricimonas rarisocia]QDU38709.1 putative aromatic acid decarboxylase [Maioricimonas rarisocia]